MKNGSLKKGNSDRDKGLIIGRYGRGSVAVGGLRFSGLLYCYSVSACVQLNRQPVASQASRK